MRKPKLVRRELIRRRPHSNRMVALRALTGAASVALREWPYVQQATAEALGESLALARESFGGEAFYDEKG